MEENLIEEGQMKEDLFENVGPPSHKIVAEYEGIHNLVKLVTHEIRPEPHQKLVIVVDGARDYISFQNLLSSLDVFLKDPEQKRFFVPVTYGFGLHIFVIEEVDEDDEIEYLETD